MLYAIRDNEKIEPSPRAKGLCPYCERIVRARCGEIYTWHWAHTKAESCEGWWEPESEWHRQWKKLFPKDNVEVVIVKNGIKHIADILTDGGVVIELQNSSIQSTVIKRRESFYGERMLWVINGIGFKHNFYISTSAIDLDRNYIRPNDSLFNIQLEKSRIPKNLVKASLTMAVKLNGLCQEEKLEKVLHGLEFEYLPDKKIYWRRRVIDNTYHLKWLISHLNNYNREYLPEYYIEENGQAHKASNTKVPVSKSETRFEWTHSRQSWRVSERHVFIDFGDQNLFHVLSGMGSSSGRGTLVTKKKFLNKYVGTRVSC